MSRPVIDLTAHRFGRLTVIERAENNKRTRPPRRSAARSSCDTLASVEKSCEQRRNRRERDRVRAEPLIWLDTPEQIAPHPGIRVIGGTATAAPRPRQGVSRSSRDILLRPSKRPTGVVGFGV
jgi:hypothetical protein